jgi:uncharacterized Zn-binding protein involved in type VI secretion
MPSVHRQFDKNTAGAPILKANQSSVYANRLLVSVDSSIVKGHGITPHYTPLTATGSSNVFIERIPVTRQGDKDTCGHVRALGSPDIFVNDGRTR